MADHGGGGHGGGGGDKKKSGGVLAAVTGNGCLRYLALYIVALVLLAGLAIANGLGLLQKLGLPAFSAPSVSHTTSTNLPASSGTSASTTGNVGTASGGGPLKAPVAMIRNAPVASIQGGQITSMIASQPFYIVQPGDTLDTVAPRFGLTRQQLRDYNSLRDEMLYTGQVLYLPDSTSPPVPNTGRNAGGGDTVPSNAGSTDDSTP